MIGCQATVTVQKKSLVKKLSTSADCAVDTAFLPFENSRDFYIKLLVKKILKVTARILTDFNFHGSMYYHIKFD